MNIVVTISVEETSGSQFFIRKYSKIFPTTVTIERILYWAKSFSKKNIQISDIIFSEYVEN